MPYEVWRANALYMRGQEASGGGYEESIAVALNEMEGDGWTLVQTVDRHSGEDIRATQTYGPLFIFHKPPAKKAKNPSVAVFV